jgi:tRNA A37 threonylcarbamoyladenosine dehydratase
MGRETTDRDEKLDIAGDISKTGGSLGSPASTSRGMRAGTPAGGEPVTAPTTPTARLQVLIGDEALARLRASTVMVLGLGGVGSSCAEALARGGVGHLVLVDRDVVDETNINRQAIAFHSTVGRAKVDVMREMVLDINPDCDVTCLHEFIEKDRIAEQLDALPTPDLVIDAIDTVAQKLRIAAWCHERGYREICSTGASNKLDPTKLEFADISETRSDPIARVMRKECRRRGIVGLEVCFSTELPIVIPIPEGAEVTELMRPVDRGLVLGTMSYMPPIMGQMIAGRAICELSGVENRRDRSSGRFSR